MFSADFYIDGVQNAKKQFVQTFLFGDTFKAELIKLIDAQTEFTKGAVKNSLAIAEAFVKNTSESVYAKAKASK